MVNSLLGWPGLVALSVVLLTALTEWLHGRRVGRVAYLAFGPDGEARRWTRCVPWLRVAAVGAIAWGLAVLIQVDSGTWDPEEGTDVAQKRIHHLVIALDVSPSMQLTDSGVKGQQTRADRARDVLRSIIERIDLRRTRVSVVAFYSEARPVVVDTFDAEVVDNILDDLPLEHAFAHGKTNMYEAIAAVAELGKTWPARTATLVLASDGDTLPPEDSPTLPPAFATKIVLGLGDPNRGTYIDGHSSRQDARSLNRLALRLKGLYHDANRQHFPTEALERIDAALPLRKAGPMELRQLALAAVLVGAMVLTLLPIALSLAGIGFKASRAEENVFGCPLVSRL